MNRPVIPVNEKYLYVALTAYREYVHWIYTSIMAEIPLLEDLARIIVDYVAMTENMHFEAVVLLRPRILSWVWQINGVLHAGDKYERWHERWSPDVIVHPDLTTLFNTKLKEMNYDAYHCTAFPDYSLYREVSIADMYNLNARTIMSSNWPIGEHRLTIGKRGLPKPAISGYE